MIKFNIYIINFKNNLDNPNISPNFVTNKTHHTCIYAVHQGEFSFFIWGRNVI